MIHTNEDKINEQRQRRLEELHAEKVIDDLKEIYPSELDDTMIREDGYTDYETYERLNDDARDTNLGTDGVFGRVFGRTNKKKKNYKKEPEEDKQTVTYLEAPTCELPRHIQERIQTMVDTMAKENNEIGGLLKIDLKDGKIIVEDFTTIEQVVGGADFEAKEEAMQKWQLEHMKDPDFHKWRGWWHSHHTMGLFWSGTDDDMFDDLKGKEKKYKDAFGIVFTTWGMLARHDIQTPNIEIKINHVPIKVIGENKMTKEDMQREADETIKDKVEVRKYKTYENEIGDDQEANKTLAWIFNIRDLVELKEVHEQFKKAFGQGWSLVQTCHLTGLDPKKVEEVIIKKNKEKQQKRK